MSQALEKILPLSFRNYVSNIPVYQYYKGYLSYRNAYKDKTKAIYVVGSPSMTIWAITPSLMRR